MVVLSFPKKKNLSLILETSGPSLSVAVFKGDDLMSEMISPPDGISHSEKLLPLIISLLKKYSLNLHQMDRFVLAQGPGAFTSLRVGMATLIGLMGGTPKPMIGVSSLRALSLVFSPEEERVVPVLKAGRGRVYAWGEIRGKVGEEFLPEGLYEPQYLKDFLEKREGLYCIGGPGLELIPEIKNAKRDFSITPRAFAVGYEAVRSGWKPLEKYSIRYLQEPDLGGKISP